MLVDLDKDEVNAVNYQESVPKMPMAVCEDFKKRCCELICVYVCACARTRACMCAHVHVCAFVFACMRCVYGCCVCMYVCVWYMLYVHVCVLCVCVLCM